MQNIKVFSTDLHDDLKDNLSNNRKDYLQSDKFIFNNYNLNPEDYKSNIELIKPESDKDFEKKNSIILYEALKDLDMSIIVEKVFWTTLSHTYYYDYIQNRMPAPVKEDTETLTSYNEKLDKFIDRHYFQGGYQYKTRHALSGLWWRAHVTYDEALNNPYEYTEKLYSFSDRDLMNAVVENTNFIKYPDLTKAFIDSILTLDYDKISGSKREFNRDIAALINLEGSTRLFNTFTYDDFMNIIAEIIADAQEV